MAELSNLKRGQLVGMVEDSVRNTLSHVSLWFRMVADELGLEEALRLDEIVWRQGLPMHVARLCGVVATEGARDVLSFPSGWNRGALVRLLAELAKSWLASDGIWFQAVEREHGMTLAKTLNDRAWRTFTVVEAERIMRRFSIPKGGGLDALACALRFRLYARVNKQRSRREGERRLVFEMNDCRVQAARRRAGLSDYPCKSAGEVEYTYFAKAIDPRIETRCITCPPDPHPSEYWCAWEFALT